MIPSTDSVRAFHNQDLLDYLNHTIFSAVTDNSFETEHIAAICVDSLLDGVHFPQQTSAEWIAHKALAVNLSDLAAMGALPDAILIGLVLPEWDWPWLKQFCSGFKELANRWQLKLLAVDVRSGPLSITIQAQGQLANARLMRRADAKPGDQIYVTGSLGAAACALHYYVNNQPLPERYQSILQQRLNYPVPRVEAGLAIAPLANACIDISDGLAADLGHILQESHVGARLQLNDLPISNAVKDLMDTDHQTHLSLMGGDDYELCFTISPDQVEQMQLIMNELQLACHCVGEIIAGNELLYFTGNQQVEFTGTGYDHFSQTALSS